jgi:hypothetical protein
MCPPKHFAAVALALGCLGLWPQSGKAFVVEDVGINPSEVVNISVANFYTGEANVGIHRLVIAGVPANGFCIDPFHFSLSSSPGYQFRPLEEAPKLPGTMGIEKAGEITKLWSMVYSPSMSAEQAAGFQVAILEIVGGDKFSVSGNDYGAGLMLQDLENYSGAPARLIAISGPGQDYVTPMPESGSTLTLFAFAAVGPFWMQRLNSLESNYKALVLLRGNRVHPASRRRRSSEL